MSSTIYWKNPVRAASTSHVVCHGTQVVDGVWLADGDRVLVKDQVAFPPNGVYTVVTSGNWRLETLQQVGDIMFVNEGTQNSQTGWLLVSLFPATYNQFAGQSGAGAGAGAGLSKAPPAAPQTSAPTRRRVLSSR